ERLGEADVAGLCRRVVRLPHLPLLAVDRGDVDDAAELAAAHALNNRAAHVEQRIEVGVDHCVPLLRAHTVEHGVAGDAGVIDEDFDGADVRLDLFYAGATRLVRADVPFERRNAGLGAELLRRLVVAAVIGGHAIAGGLQCLRDGGPDSAG